eukprot:10215482-Alexandrium_andersonii.AAC.1
MSRTLPSAGRPCLAMAAEARPSGRSAWRAAIPARGPGRGPVPGAAEAFIWVHQGRKRRWWRGARGAPSRAVARVVAQEGPL